MSEKTNNFKKQAMGILKSLSKRILIIGLILFFAFFSIAAVYVNNKDDMDKVSVKNSTYSAGVDSSGNIVYTYKNPDDETTEVVTSEEMAKDFMSELSDYIDGDEQEKIEDTTFLIEAETVTKQPYIDSIPEGQVNGRIKFYRYSEAEGEINADDVNEDNRLKYMPFEEFNNKLEAYKTDAEANRDILKHFTVDENGAVVIACGTEEYRNIQTGVEGTAKDRDLTVDIINGKSTARENYTGNVDNGFLATEFTIFTKTIDYLSLVEQYVMPSNLLYSLLIQTRDIEFVKAVANLAYESEIAIGIYDNTSYSETNEIYTYKKLIKMNVETKFDYKDTLVSITETEPSITIKENDLANSPYEDIITKCETKTTDNGKIEHRTSYKKEGNQAWSSVTGNNMYISGTNANNEITNLGNGEIYKTTYKRTINSMSTPTIGVLLADTWIAKWEASYTKEETSSPGSSTPETELENKEIASYTNGNILSAFGTQFRNNISGKIKTHGDGLRTDVISKIVSSIPESVYTVKTEEDAVDEESTQQRKETIETQLNAQGTISYKQTLSGNKQYTNIKYSSSSSGSSSKYERSETIERTKDGEKFSEIFNDNKFHETKKAILNREEWFWEYIQENEDTAKLEDTLKYLLNIATNSTDFGTFTPEEVEKLFDVFKPKELANGNSVSTISPFGTQMTREEFIQAVQNYNGGTYYSILSNVAEDFYDVCTLSQYNVNPCLAFAWACLETEYGKHIPDKNLFGMGIDNGQTSGEVYTSYKDSIEDFCRWVIRHSTSAGTKARAQEYATVNSKFNGDPENNIYSLFCGYMYLGHTHIADEPDFNNPAGYNYYNENGSNWGSGGRIYIYHMYERGGLYKGEYATRCGHSNGSDETTLQEKADYVQYSVESRIKIARDIFGNGIFLSGEGTYEEINDKDRFGVYTASSGRSYTEWIQSSRTTWGGLTLNAWSGTMAQYGCGLYTSTMLLNSVGIDITPGDFYNKFNYDFLGTIQSILNENEVEGKAKMVYTSDYNKYFSVLLDGHGVMSYLSSESDYTNNKHWIAVADIRDTQTGSKYGYDLYVLSSTHKSRSRIWMGSSGKNN